MLSFNLLFQLALNSSVIIIGILPKNIHEQYQHKSACWIGDFYTITLHAPRNLKVRVYDPTGYSSMSRMTSSSIATIVVILQSIFGGIFRGTGRQRMGSIVHATGYGVGLIIGVPLLFCTELSLAGDNTHTDYTGHIVLGQFIKLLSRYPFFVV